MMLANHTSIRGIFNTLRLQFNKLKSRNAHVQHFRETRLFSDSLDEFDNAEEVVHCLIDEYEAAERSDYIEWGQGKADNSVGSMDAF
jgi:tubulin gamma